MMLALPSLAPFDVDADDIFDQLAPASMVGQSDEIFEGGVAGWKQNPAVLGAGLLAFVRELKPMADKTPKMPGDLFLERLRALGIDPTGVSITPDAIRQDDLLGDGGNNGE